MQQGQEQNIDLTRNLLQKPFRAQVLLERVRQLLDQVHPVHGDQTNLKTSGFQH